MKSRIGWVIALVATGLQLSQAITPPPGTVLLMEWNLGQANLAEDPVKPTFVETGLQPTGINSAGVTRLAPERRIVATSWRSRRMNYQGSLEISRLILSAPPGSTNRLLINPDQAPSCSGRHRESLAKMAFWRIAALPCGCSEAVRSEVSSFKLEEFWKQIPRRSAAASF
jgi:hypothetical protein